MILEVEPEPNVKVIRAFASTLPVKVTPRAFSRALILLSSATSLIETAGTSLSKIKFSDADNALVFPAASVAVALTAFDPDVVNAVFKMADQAPS